MSETTNRRWLMAKSEWVSFTNDVGVPIAINPSLVATVRPLHRHPGTMITLSGAAAVVLAEDFETVMAALSGKRT